MGGLMREKKRVCPRCGNKQVVSLSSCSECGLKFSRLSNATHAEAMKAFKEKDKERVVYVNEMPSDLNKTKFIVSLIFGFFGVTSFYVGKKNKGWYSLLSFLALFSSMYLQTILTDKGITDGFLNYVFTTTFGLLCAGSFLMWLDDIIKAITGKYKFPVALPKEKPNEDVLNIRKEVYDEIMKEKERFEKETQKQEGKNLNEADCEVIEEENTSTVIEIEDENKAKENGVGNIEQVKMSQSNEKKQKNKQKKRKK